MAAYDEEIFGPVMTICRVDTIQEAIDLINSNKWGNGTSIFTKSGGHARKYQHEIEAGQIGINLPNIMTGCWVLLHIKLESSSLICVGRAYV